MSIACVGSLNCVVSDCGCDSVLLVMGALSSGKRFIVLASRASDLASPVDGRMLALMVSRYCHRGLTGLSGWLSGTAIEWSSEAVRWYAWQDGVGFPGWPW